ncbi:MAG: hypothetical protein ACLSAO_07210 [Anaerovoracaceae bacterium]
MKIYGIRDSYARMPSAKGDASQGTFFEIYGNLVMRDFLYYKKLRAAKDYSL